MTKLSLPFHNHPTAPPVIKKLTKKRQLERAAKMHHSILNYSLSFALFITPESSSVVM